MLFITRLVLIGLLGVGFSAATTAQAANQLFTGEWFTFSFGNECAAGTGRTTTGNGNLLCESEAKSPRTGESFVYSGFGIPIGIQCNAKWPRCPFDSTPTTPTMDGAPGSFHPLGGSQIDATYCRPWYNIYGQTTGGSAMNLTGTMRPAKGETLFETTVTGMKGTSKIRPIPPLYRNPIFFTKTANGNPGLPNATFCTASSTTLGGFPGQETENGATLGLGGGRPGAVMAGAPVTGTWTAQTTTNGGFTFPAAPAPNGNGGVRVDGLIGDFPNVFPYLYSYTYATLRNNYGVFGAGSGPGDFSITYGVGANADATARVRAGKNKFGGTMRMLGRFNTKVCYFRNDGCSLGRNDWRYDAIGVDMSDLNTAGGEITGGYVATYVAKYYPTGLMQNSTILVNGSRFPWTTGSVTVRAVGRGPHKTVHTAMGYDNRDTATHKGTIQLVSPILTRWNQPAANFETGGIGIFRIKFVPEPQTWALLIAGVSLLGVGYRMRGR